MNNKKPVSPAKQKLVNLIRKILSPGTDRGSTQGIIDTRDFFPLADAINEQIVPDRIEAFLKWRDTPVYRPSGNVGFQLRCLPQMPEYNTYIVIDDSGNSIFPKGKFLTHKELVTYFLSLNSEK